MPRTPRIEFENATYHFTARGNNRHQLFKNSDDFIMFTGLLSSVIYEHGWICYSCCLMNNHYHMTLLTPEANLSIGIQKLHSRYSFYYRNKYDYTGKLFEVYKTSLICDDSYVLEAIRYDLLNPVRAKLVQNPEDWCWSSYSETAGLEPDSGWIDNNWVRSLFGNPSRSHKKFIDFIKNYSA